jgi:hypothetical protein
MTALDVTSSGPGIAKSIVCSSAEPSGRAGGHDVGVRDFAVQHPPGQRQDEALVRRVEAEPPDPGYRADGQRGDPGHVDQDTNRGHPAMRPLHRLGAGCENRHFRP